MPHPLQVRPVCARRIRYEDLDAALFDEQTSSQGLGCVEARYVIVSTDYYQLHLVRDHKPCHPSCANCRPYWEPGCETDGERGLYAFGNSECLTGRVKAHCTATSGARDGRRHELLYAGDISLVAVYGQVGTMQCHRMAARIIDECEHSWVVSHLAVLMAVGEIGVIP
jgi:hypothetical protein